MRKSLLAAFFSIALLSISHQAGAQTLINYWNFNNLTITDTFPNIPLINADYSAINVNNAYMLYTFDSGTTTKSKDSAWIDNVAGSTVNAQQGAPAGNCLRVRNPSDFTQLQFFIPTTNYKNISVSYALQSSSAKSGQAVEAFAYSVDSGVTWKTASLTVEGANVDTLLDTAAVYINGFGLVTIGFGSDTTVNNNSKLVLRISFKSYGTGAITGTSGNARIDNVAVLGSILTSSITVLTPPAGDTLLAGQHELISYALTGAISQFRAIDYSYDSGANWTEIDESIQDTFTWTVPNTPSNNCFVRISDQNGITGKSGRFLILTMKPPPPPPDTTHVTAPAGLIDYWNFTQLTTADTVPNVPRLKAFYSAIDTNTATIIDTLQPGTSKYYVGWCDNVAGDTTNHQLGDTSKNALRVRNPSDSMEVLMRIRSTGYKNLVVQYGLESSSTKSGQLVEVFDYSTDGGTTWKSSALTVQGANVDTLDVTNAIFQGTSWGLVTVTFGNDTTVNNNPNLILRITFRGNTTGTSGNNRLEHVTLEGAASSAPPPPPPPPVPDSIVVTAPVKGDTLLAGTQQTISYTVTSSTSYSRSIQYSTNGGSTWTNVATGVTSLSYTWTVPSTPTSNGLVRVVDTTGVIGSSSKFVIVVPGTVDSVWLSTSNVIAGASTTINWSATGYLGTTLNIDVYYDGVTPNPIVSGYAFGESTSYPWTVPDAEVNGVFIRITFASGSMGTSSPFNIVASAGVPDVSNATPALGLWPNPAENELHFTNVDAASFIVSVFDEIGHQVLTATTNSDGTVDISNLASGMYFVRIRNAATGAVSTANFVKQ